MLWGEQDGAAVEKTLPVVIYDLCPLFREALASLLVGVPGFSIAEVTGDARQVLPAITSAEAGLAVLDLDAGSQALDLLQKIKDYHKGCRCVMMLTDGANPELMAAIRMEADGFISKRLAPNDIAQQFSLVCSGEIVISDAFANALAVTLRAVPYPDDDRDIGLLSPRELEVLKCIAKGMSNRLIGEKLSITDGTVKVHVKHLLKKLSFSSRVEAALWASENGLREST